MNNKLNDFDEVFEYYTGQGFLPYKRKDGTVSNGWYGDDIHYFSLNPDVLKLLEKTDAPKKMVYLRLPFDTIFISNKLKFGNLELPYGICINFSMETWGIKPTNDIERKFNDMHQKIIEKKKLTKNEVDLFGDTYSYYSISFYYISDNGEGIITFKMQHPILPLEDCVWEPEVFDEYVGEMSDDEFEEYNDRITSDSEFIDSSNKLIKEYSLFDINKFIYKLLLFIDCPDVELKKTEGRAKHFRKKGYDFFEPKKHYAELSHDLRKYLQEIKREYGVKFRYHYKYMVRGHFRTMSSSRYKQKNTIWIKPYFKGKGKYVKKERIVCRNI